MAVSPCVCRNEVTESCKVHGPLPSKAVRDGMQKFILNKSDLTTVMRNFLNDIERGLKKSTHDSSAVKCFITYVQNLPNGKEEGKFLALDLGGTNFRVLLIEFKNNDCQMKSKIFVVPPAIMVGTGEKLFDHVAQCVSEFVKEEKVETSTLPLGFTFSFPLKQVGLGKGLLQSWSKGFNCSGVIGNDVVDMLKKSIQKIANLKIEVFAILNDTTGTLLSCAWKNHNCKVGVIIGTGTNACYLEKQKNAEFFDEPDNGSGMVVINTEWGAFGNDGKLDNLLTDYDKEIDKKSINPGKQVFEKMISGMYIGELVRLPIIKFAESGNLFKGKLNDKINVVDSFLAKYISDIERDPTGDYTTCEKILRDDFGLNPSNQDLIDIRFICECVTRRSAHLVAAALATLLNKMGDPDVTIGVDGTVYRIHPKYSNLVTKKMQQLVDKGIAFELMLSEDGSGRGAALVAAVEARMGPARKYETNAWTCTKECGKCPK